jgi:formylglycine-generating enzyme required for sulfatase activity
MVQLPAGTYVPFFARASRKSLGSADQHKPVSLAAFRLDKDPVSNANFLAFVRAHPEWRRSAIKRIFADPDYLAQWKSDLALGNAEDAKRPVTNVSWFAAEAYCEAQGGSLPMTDQWEYALADKNADARGLKDRILVWYGTPSTAPLASVEQGHANGYGVRGLVGLVWEWTLDFNSMMSGADLRAGEEQFCGGGALGAADPSDYASFMRYSMRASLKASYTTKNLGFRCASPS